MKLRHLTVGNEKLKKSGVGASFDLQPEKTCIGAGDCKGCCYSKKICRLYKDYATKVKRNTRLAKTPKFESRIMTELDYLKPKFFRIHGGGDFFSQGYLNRWVKIMKRYPEIHFYAYSKSLKLRFPKLKNFTLIKSHGGKWDHLIKPRDIQAKIVEKGCIPKGYVVGNGDDLWWLKSRKCALIRH